MTRAKHSLCHASNMSLMKKSMKLICDLGTLHVWRSNTGMTTGRPRAFSSSVYDEWQQQQRVGCHHADGITISMKSRQKTAFSRLTWMLTGGSVKNYSVETTTTNLAGVLCWPAAIAAPNSVREYVICVTAYSLQTTASWSHLLRQNPNKSTSTPRNSRPFMEADEKVFIKKSIVAVQK